MSKVGVCLGSVLLFTSIHRIAARNCPKSRGRSCNVALRDTEMVLVGPFWPSYTAQIYGRSVAPTPFRTVSEGTFSETQRFLRQEEGSSTVGTCQRGFALIPCGETKERTPIPGASSTQVRLKRATRCLAWGDTMLLDLENAIAPSATFPCPATCRRRAA